MYERHDDYLFNFSDSRDVAAAIRVNRLEFELFTEWPARICSHRLHVSPAQERSQRVQRSVVSRGRNGVFEYRKREKAKQFTHSIYDCRRRRALVFTRGVFVREFLESKRYTKRKMVCNARIFCFNRSRE